MIETPTTIETPARRVRVRPERGLSGWRAVCAVGALLVLLVVAAVHVLAATLIPPLLVLGVVAAAILLLLARGPARVGAVLGVLLGLFALLSDVSGTLTGLSLVRDPFEFTLAVTGVAGGLALLIGGVAVLLKRPAGRATRPIAWVAAAAVPAALLLSGVLRATMPAAAAQPGDVAFTIAEFAFPEQVSATAGQAGFVVTNADPVAHTFTVPGAGVHVLVPGGTTVRGTGDLAPGEYAYVCRVAGHDFMEGTLIVE